MLVTMLMTRCRSRLVPKFAVSFAATFAASFTLTLAVCVSPLHAWHDEGHVYVALAAVAAQPAEVPPFFREGAATVAHLSLDPDLHCERSLPAARDAEASDHYLDLELLQGQPLAATRSEHVKACQALGLDYTKVGTLPWAILERTQHLALAFAEHRRWPDNPHIQLKILLYAGLLAHYTADLHMPLHTSVHFNGRTPRNPDGTFGRPPNSGIHAKIDALPTKLTYHTLFTQPLPALTPVENLDALWPYVLDQFHQSHALVDAAYALESALPDVADLTPLTGDVAAFTVERTRAAAHMTATLFHAAWTISATMEIPFWLDRPTFDDHLNRDEIPSQPARPK